MIKKILIGLGLFFVADKVIRAIGTKVMGNVEFSFGRANFDMSGLFSILPKVRVNLPMTITNHNPAGLTVTNFVGELFYGGVKLSDVTIPVPGVIPANGVGTLTLRFDITAQMLISDIIASLQSSGTFTTLVNVIRLKGTLSTDIIPIPLDTPISIV